MATLPSLVLDPSPPAQDIVDGAITTKQHNAIVNIISGDSADKMPQVAVATLVADLASKASITNPEITLPALKQTTAFPGSPLQVAELVAETANDASDGFGAELQFKFTDTGVTKQLQGRLYFERDGADDQALFRIENSQQFLLEISSSGMVQLYNNLDLLGFNLTASGLLELMERAAADTPVSGRGQIWVKNTTPNQLWYTDDAGGDFQLGLGYTHPNHTGDVTSTGDGATVIATAGSPEKRSLLKQLGVDHVLDSRSLAFAGEVLRLTGGKGVEVVLNSLSGEAMERSIEVLAPFGRFLELGKRDYYENTHLGLRPFRRNLSYFGIDADQLLIHQPALAERLLGELMQLFADGALSPLPHRAFEADNAVAAFRLMQQAGHIGKIVIRPPAVPLAEETAETVAPVALQASASQVVVGGFGGFGAALIRRLAGMGARRVDVLSRRGATTPEAAALIEEMATQGVTIAGHACDATDEETLSATLDAVRAEAGSIAGVFHTAMVLHDTLMANLTRDQLDAVLAPKVRGAELLDRLTRDDPLRHFVMFSSATTLVGNPGQANYVAANGYLEGLAARRRAHGLPALAVAWGAISDAGYLARNADVGDKLARKLGRHALSAGEALDGLAALMALPQDDVASAAVGYARIDWAAARRDLALLATPYAERLGINAGDETDGEGGIVDLAALVKGLDRASAIARICKLLAVEIGRILRIGEDDIDPARPLTEVGMDSLMALELRMAAERQFGIDIPLMSLANGATLSDMAARITDQVTGGGGSDVLSGEARANAIQHLGEEAFEDAEALADVAAEVEQRTRDMRSLL